MRFLRVGRIALHQVQANRLPGATHLESPVTFTGATHQHRCHPPNSATVPNVQFLTVGRAARHRVQADRLPGAMHRCRCHPPFPVPPTFAVSTPGACPHGAWQPIRPASRMYGFLGSGGSPDTRCRRLACRCHPPYSASEPSVQLLTVRFVTERGGHQVQAGRLPGLGFVHCPSSQGVKQRATDGSLVHAGHVWLQPIISPISMLRNWRLSPPRLS